MTVAARIETGAGEQAQPGPGSGLGSGRGSFLTRSAGSTADAAWNRPGAPGSSMSSVPGSESFRSKWQSQLASLAGETWSLGKQSLNAESLGREQETTAGKPEVNDAAAEETTADKFQTTQAQSTHTQATQALLARLADAPQDRPQQDGSQPGGQQQSAEARVLTDRPGNAARLINAVVQIGAPEPGEESADAAIASSADSKSRQTSRDHSSAHHDENKKLATAAAGKPSDTSTAAAIIPAPPMPLPLVTNPVPNRAETKTVFSLPTAFVNESRNTVPSLHDRSAAEPSAAGPAAAGTQHRPLAGTETVQLIAAVGTEPGSGGSLTTENWNGTKAESGAANLPNLSDQTSNANQAIAIGDIASPAAAPAQSPAQHQDAGHAQSHPPETQAAATSNNGQSAGQPLLPGQSPVSQPIPAPIAASTSANPSGTRPVAGPIQSSSVQSVKRNTRESGSPGNGSTAPPGQLTPAAGDAASMMRDAAAVRTAANSAGSHTATAEPALREAFAAMDADTSPGAPTWLHVGVRQAEAGFEDPALGWVGVRAGMDGGAVHATLIPGSDAAAQELGLHMDGLNAYMAEQHTPIESLAMAAPEARSAGHGAEQGFSQGMGQGSNQSSNQSSNQGSNPGPDQSANQGSGHHAQQQTYTGSELASGLRVSGVGSSAPAGPATLSSARSPVLPLAPSGTAPPGEGGHISVVA